MGIDFCGGEVVGIYQQVWQQGRRRANLHRGMYVFRYMLQLDNQPQGCSCRDLSRLVSRSCEEDDCGDADHDTIVESIPMDSASLK